MGKNPHWVPGLPAGGQRFARGASGAGMRGHDGARYGAIWRDMARYGAIWRDMAIWRDTARNSAIPDDTPRYREYSLESTPRTSGEASGWVWWSSSRTDWNHGHGCCHGVRGRCQSAQAAGQHGSAAEHHFVTGAAQCVRRTTGGQLQSSRVMRDTMCRLRGAHTRVWSVRR